MRYLTVAEAYRDLEQLSSRLALTERLAAQDATTTRELAELFLTARPTPTGG